MTLGSKNAKFDLFGLAQFQIATMLHSYAASRKSRLGPSRSFILAAIESSYMTLCRQLVVIFALSSVVSDILRRAGAWRHYVRAAVYRITKFMIGPTVVPQM